MFRQREREREREGGGEREGEKKKKRRKKREEKDSWVSSRNSAAGLADAHECHRPWLQAQSAGSSVTQGTSTQLRLADNEPAQAVLPELQVAPVDLERADRHQRGEWRAACAGGPIYRTSVANIGPFVRGFSHQPIIGTLLPTALISVLVADISGPAALRYYRTA
jgi:hypothetical protein